MNAMARELKRTFRFEAKAIQDCRERIKELREGYGITSDTQIVPVQGGANGDRVAWAVCEIERLEDLMRVHVALMWAYLVHLDTQAQRDVIKLRYIEGKKPTEVALKLKYSEDHIFTLQRQAITVIGEKLLTLPQGIA